MNRITRCLLAGAMLCTLGSISYSQVPGVNSTLNSVFNLVYEPATAKATFVAAFTVPPTSTATNIVEIRGSATKTVKVRRIRVNGIATTAINALVVVARHSAANTAGSASGTTPAIAVYDTASPTSQNSATAVVEAWTSNPVEPVAVSYLAEYYVALGNYTTTQPQNLDLNWGALGGVPVLRGVAQTLVIDLAGVTYSGGLINVSVEWTEE